MIEVDLLAGLELLRRQHNRITVENGTDVLLFDQKVNYVPDIHRRVTEIGLRRAVGATRTDIRNQFLLEAVLVCFIGGVIGICMGLSISYIVAVTVELPVAFAWESMILSFAISALVGVAFGWFPAIRAANVNPIEALQGE